MNGEIQQASEIVIGARKALFENENIVFEPKKYVQSVRFVFLPKGLFGKAVEADSVGEWFDICLQRGLEDVKFFVPSGRENRHLLGFANSSQCRIFCFWKNGRVSCFCPTWEADREHNGWKIEYREQRIKKSAVLEQLHFFDRTDELMQVLLDIKAFAAEIESLWFADIFQQAYDILYGDADIDKKDVPGQLPNSFQAIYYAVDKADVFGAMGSWNDSPFCYAHEKGLEQEYHRHSNRLLVQLRYHLMYVTNECWKRG